MYTRPSKINCIHQLGLKLTIATNVMVHLWTLNKFFFSFFFTYCIIIMFFAIWSPWLDNLLTKFGKVFGNLQQKKTIFSSKFSKKRKWGLHISLINKKNSVKEFQNLDPRKQQQQLVSLNHMFLLFLLMSNLQWWFDEFKFSLGCTQTFQFYFGSIGYEGFVFIYASLNNF